MIDRRKFSAGLIAGLALLLAGEAEARPGRRARRRTRRRVRRRVRRRIRRRVVRRNVRGRKLWVVPVAAAVGWELMLDDRVVVVVQEQGAKKDEPDVHVLVVQDSSGKNETVEVVREDTADNSQDLKGSELPEGDTTTPAIETEEEVEVAE